MTVLEIALGLMGRMVGPENIDQMMAVLSEPFFGSEAEPVAPDPDTWGTDAAAQEGMRAMMAVMPAAESRPS